MAQCLRGELVDQELERHEREYGAFTEEEIAQARAEIYGLIQQQPTDSSQLPARFGT
ncbi:hypothetical protein ACIHCQ_02355 [Streptomyces sp. NPDC052236]|uniref:hypothetical protein n=1 Tax=Streptomyces sp. NPDC052236 TaxID=3365686 RepID=UPI0037D4915B